MKVLNIFLLLYFFTIGYCYGFKPDVTNEIPLPAKATNSLHSHVGMTVSSLKLIEVNEFGEKLTFSEEAINTIKKKNKFIDNQDNEKSKSSIYHCDDENIELCTKEIKKQKDNIISELKKTPPNAQLAREILGEVLHTLQDFYSHSNWVHIKHGDNLSKYTKSIDGIEIAKLGEIIIPSPDTSVSIGAGFGGIFGIHFDTLANTKMCTWESSYLTITAVDDAIDFTLFPTTLAPTNKLRESGEKEVTSGYFMWPYGVSDPAVYKCDHGISVPVSEGNLDTRIGTEKTRGLNKDHDGQDHFNEAFSAAKGSTKYFVEQILNSEGIKGNEDVIRAFLDRPKAKSGSIGFIVDTTGSMGDTITGIQKAMHSIVAKIDLNPEIDVTDFLVMSYGDPNLGDPEIATTPSRMRELINAITLGVPDGGGDAPERTYAALQEAINKASDGSTLYVYTDNTTKEPELASAIRSRAKEKNIQVVFFVSNPSLVSEYSPVAGTLNVKPYEHTIAGAEGTVNSISLAFTGDSHTTTAISDSIGGASSGAKAKTRIASEKLNIVSYTSPDGNSAEHFMPVNLKSKTRAILGKSAAKEYPIDVDSSVENIAVNINMIPLGEIKLYRPDGTEVIDTDADVEILKSSVSQFISVNAPTVGQWKLTVAGDDGVAYDVDVKMNTDIHFISFNFAEEKGRPGHTGLFPLDGQPLLSDTQYIVSTLAGEITDVELALISLKGDELKKIALTELDKTSDSARYVGEIDLPSESFRVRAQGKDKSGNAFERVYPVVYKGQSVSVTSVSTADKMIRSSDFTARFTIKNTGVADTFKLSATDISNYIKSINLPEITLNTDESKEVEVLMGVPLGALDGDTDTVTLTAISTNNGESKNSASTTFSVSDDGDGDGSSDTAEKGDSGVFDGNNDGTPDYLQSDVTSFFAYGSNIMITLEVIGTGELSLVKGTPLLSPDTKPDDYTFPLNLFSFSIKGLANGEKTQLKIYNSAGVTPNKYYQFGATSTLATSHWSEFTGIVSSDNTVTLTLQDGVDGDHDLLENGTITNIGGFALSVNKLPVAVTDTITTSASTSKTMDVLKNDSDPDGDTLSITKFDAKSVQGGGVVKNSDNTFTYTPKAGYTGSDSFTYTISDGNDGTSIGTVTITVNPVVTSTPTTTTLPTTSNRNPTIVNDVASTAQGSTVTIKNVLANDTDPDGGTLTITQFDSTSKQNGTVEKTGSDSFTYTPASGFSGTDSFTYTVSDGQGGTTKGTVEITVNKAETEDTGTGGTNTGTTGDDNTDTSTDTGTTEEPQKEEKNGSSSFSISLLSFLALFLIVGWYFRRKNSRKFFS